MAERNYRRALGVLAIFFGTLGRSTAAALGGVFAWFIFESASPYLFGFFMNAFTSGPIHDLLKAIPDYLFINNIEVLALSGHSVSTSSDVHAIIVVGAYFVLLIGASCLITMRRDVTH